MNPNNRCTCGQVWMSVVPPPPCPVHSYHHHCCCHNHFHQAYAHPYSSNGTHWGISLTPSTTDYMAYYPTVWVQ